MRQRRIYLKLLHLISNFLLSLFNMFGFMFRHLKNYFLSVTFESPTVFSASTVYFIWFACNLALILPHVHIFAMRKLCCEVNRHRAVVLILFMTLIKDTIWNVARSRVGATRKVCIHGVRPWKVYYQEMFQSCLVRPQHAGCEYYIVVPCSNFAGSVAGYWVTF